MLDKIKEAFAQFTFLSPLDLIELAKIIRIKQVKKGDHVAKVGAYNYDALKVIKGLLLHYTIDENGNERSLMFVPEKMHSGGLKTLLQGKPADENIVALENSVWV